MPTTYLRIHAAIREALEVDVSLFPIILTPEARQSNSSPCFSSFDCRDITQCTFNREAHEMLIICLSKRQRISLISNLIKRHGGKNGTDDQPTTITLPEIQPSSLPISSSLSSLLSLSSVPSSSLLPPIELTIVPLDDYPPSTPVNQMIANLNLTALDFNQSFESVAAASMARNNSSQQSTNCSIKAAAAEQPLATQAEGDFTPPGYLKNNEILNLKVWTKKLQNLKLLREAICYFPLTEQFFELCGVNEKERLDRRSEKVESFIKNAVEKRLNALSTGTIIDSVVALADDRWKLQPSASLNAGSRNGVAASYRGYSDRSNSDDLSDYYSDSDSDDVVEPPLNNVTQKDELDSSNCFIGCAKIIVSRSASSIGVNRLCEVPLILLDENDMEKKSTTLSERERSEKIVEQSPNSQTSESPLLLPPSVPPAWIMIRSIPLFPGDGFSSYDQSQRSELSPMINGVPIHFNDISSLKGNAEGPPHCLFKYVVQDGCVSRKVDLPNELKRTFDFLNTLGDHGILDLDLIHYDFNRFMGIIRPGYSLYCQKLVSLMNEYDQPDEVAVISNCIMIEENSEKDIKEKLSTAVEELKKWVAEHLRNQCAEHWRTDTSRLALASAAYVLSHLERQNRAQTFDHCAKDIYGRQRRIKKSLINDDADDDTATVDGNHEEHDEGSVEEEHDEDTAQALFKEMMEGPQCRDTALPFSVTFPWVFFSDELLKMKSNCTQFVRSNAPRYFADHLYPFNDTRN